jgi:hypothetical protein
MNTITTIILSLQVCPFPSLPRSQLWTSILFKHLDYIRLHFPCHKPLDLIELMIALHLEMENRNSAPWPQRGRFQGLDSCPSRPTAHSNYRSGIVVIQRDKLVGSCSAKLSIAEAYNRDTYQSQRETRKAVNTKQGPASDLRLMESIPEKRRKLTMGIQYNLEV